MTVLRSVAAISRVEILRLLRSPASLTLLLIVPAMQILLFGFAIRPTATEIAVAIAGADERGRLALAVAHEPGLRLVGADLAPGQAEAAVRSGAAAIGIELSGAPGSAGSIRVVVDSSNPALTAGVDAKIEAAYWHLLAARAGAAPLVPAVSIDHLFNPDSRADWGFLPALVGVIMMIGMTILGTLSLARERETGTWETMLTLPVGPSVLVLGKIAPYVAIGTVQGITVLTIGKALFGLPMTGSIAALVALMPLFAAAHLILGHALAARAATQLEALQGAIGFYLPAMLLSGFLYPSQTLPGWARAIGEIFPLTHFIRAARSATLRGGTTWDVLGYGVPIIAFLVAAFALVRVQNRPRLS
jgi:ABC-2 type transport system permease protein